MLLASHQAFSQQAPLTVAMVTYPGILLFMPTAKIFALYILSPQHNGYMGTHVCTLEIVKEKSGQRLESEPADSPSLVAVHTKTNRETREEHLQHVAGGETNVRVYTVYCQKQREKQMEFIWTQRREDGHEDVGAVDTDVHGGAEGQEGPPGGALDSQQHRAFQACKQWAYRHWDTRTDGQTDRQEVLHNAATKQEDRQQDGGKDCGQRSLQKPEATQTYWLSCT